MYKTVSGNLDRDSRQETLYRHGDYCYRLEPEWGRLPAAMAYTPVVAGSCDNADNLYLATRDPANPVVMLDAEGRFVRTLGAGMFAFMHGIFATDAGTLLCADADRHQIVEMDTAGKEIRRIGSGQPSDSGHDGSLWRKRQLAGDCIPMDKPFVPDWAFYESIATIKRAAPPFNRPTAAAVAPNGDIFVSDGYANAAVHHFAADGTLRRTWGGPGTEPGRFLVPHHVRVDSQGRVWVAAREGNSVQVFSADGELLAFIKGGLYQPVGVWTDAEHAYIAERGGLTIVGMDLELKAQLGYSFSGLAPHAICGNSRSELFLLMLTADRYHNIMRLCRVS